MAARAFLDGLFRTAIAAAHPSSCLPPHLPPAPRSGRLIVLAAGKAAGSMTEGAEAFYSGLPARQISGVAVARQGYGRPTKIIPVIEAGHPIPNSAGVEAAERALALADGAGPDDLVLVLLSGGASANWIAPVEGLTLAALVDSGGFGRYIIDGIAVNDNAKVFAGGLLVALLAIAFELVLALLQRAITSPGIRAEGRIKVRQLATDPIVPATGPAL